MNYDNSFKPFEVSYLQVSELHTVRYQLYGNPKGQPILFLHGGPGLGILPDHARFFDPCAYCVVLPDQRGAGLSKPVASLESNTTWDLVEDIERLRLHLGIESWVVSGGSWGSLLGLVYAINFPDSVVGLILRGVFLGRQEDTDWLYSGGGAAKIFPEAWAQFRAIVKENEESQTIEAYHKLLNHSDSYIAMRAAKSWVQYANNTMNMLPDEEGLNSTLTEHQALALARIECWYHKNHFFLPTGNYVLENINNLNKIRCHIVHGRYDVVCNLGQAYLLHNKYSGSTLSIVPNGGHSPFEKPMLDALTGATNDFRFQH